MYAIVATGGKQYKVAENDVIKVEKLDAKAGAKVTLSDVVAVGAGASLKVGAPLVDGAAVVAEVLEQTRAPRVLIFKKKRRQNYRRKNGHAQEITVLRVVEIKADGVKREAKTEQKKAEKPKAEAKADAKPTAKKPAAKKPAAKKPAAKKDTK